MNTMRVVSAWWLTSTVTKATTWLTMLSRFLRTCATEVLRAPTVVLVMVRVLCFRYPTSLYCFRVSPCPNRENTAQALYSFTRTKPSRVISFLS